MENQNPKKLAVFSVLFLVGGFSFYLLVKVIRDPNILLQYPCLIPRTGVQYGEVLDNAGKPIAGARITYRQTESRVVLPLPFMPGVRCEHTGTAETDSGGQFSFREKFREARYLSVRHTEYTAGIPMHGDEYFPTKRIVSGKTVIQFRMEPISPEERASEPEIVVKFRNFCQLRDIEVRSVAWTESNPNYFGFLIFLTDENQVKLLMEEVADLGEVQKAEFSDTYKFLPRLAYVTIWLKNQFVDPSVHRQETESQFGTQGRASVVSVSWLPVKVTEASKNIHRNWLVELGKDKKLLESSVSAVPFRRNMSIVGVRLVQIAPSSVWSALGLLQGDVIESYNGREVREPANLLKRLYPELSSNDMTILKVRRRDERIKLTLRNN